MATTTIHFEVEDRHPGRGKKRQVVFQETLDFETDVPNAAIVPKAGLHYLELMKKWNGKETAPHLFNGSKKRYEVRYWRT